MHAGSAISTAALAWALCACAAGAAPTASAVHGDGRVSREGAATGAEPPLVEHIPAGALRCVASSSLSLDAEQRALMVLVSQTESLPWTLDVPVVAYARARVRTDEGYQTLAWLQFGHGSGGPEQIRAALDLSSGVRLRWPDDPGGCANAVDCPDTLASFESPHVVRLSKGGPLVVAGSADNPCARLSREFPDAIEVASWNHDSGFASEMGLQRSDQVIALEGDGLSQLRRRRYVDDQHQVNAYQEMLFGTDELPMIAGLPVVPYREVRGLTLIEHTGVLWDDLRLVVEDQARSRQARRPTRDEGGLSSESLEELRDQARMMLAALDRKPPSERQEATRLLARWLTRARQLHPRDEALAGVHYRAFLDELGDARSALEVADAMLTTASGDVLHWQLNRRRALAHLGAMDLAPALAEAHGLSRGRAARMASEVVAAVQRGEAFERAEWGWLTAKELTEASRQVSRVRSEPVTLSLSTLPRTLAYLAARSPALRGTYGVHVMASGRLTRRPLPHDEVWAAVSDGGGKPAWVGAASALDDAQLRELSRLLGDQLEDGPVQLVVSVRALGGPASDAARLVFQGQLHGDRLNVQRMDPRSARLDWSRIQQLLADPLSRLSSRGFPPDELRVPAADEATAAQMVAWGESEEGVSCQHVERWVVCRGPMHDAGAALRTLLRIGDRVLSEQSLLLWGRSPR